MIRTVFLAFVIALLLSPSPTAEARNTEHFYPVSDATRSELGKEKLLGVPFYFEGQKHPSGKVLGTWSANRSTRGAFRSDEESCKVAFLSALIALQERAQAEGGDAIVGIKSITRGKPTSSATQYRCVAGAMIVHVGLEGRVVKTR